MDAQVVWNFGYLGLEMLMGHKFMTKLGKDKEISWAKVKELTEGNAKLYELIEGCFRSKYK